MKFLPLFFLCLGCVDVRPISRVEYGRNDFVPHGGRDINASYAFGEVGAHIPIGPVSFDAMVGPQGAWTDETEPEAGLNLNPRVMWFFDKDSYVHLELDATLYDHENNLFTFFAVEKVW